tara:strand:- start:150 stop:284 length:135 start_codon:yes stop_codon:yes gene_type:complete
MIYKNDIAIALEPTALNLKSLTNAKVHGYKAPFKMELKRATADS